MYNEDGYKDYWGLDDNESIPNFKVALDISKTILKDHCPQFPMDEESYNELEPWQQEYVNNAVYIQTKQVLDHFDWYVSNGASQVVSSQSVGRTSISYDTKTMVPNDRLNPIAKSMMDFSGVCHYGVDMIVGGYVC